MVTHDRETRGERQKFSVSHGWKDFLQQTIQRAFGLILAKPQFDFLPPDSEFGHVVCLDVSGRDVTEGLESTRAPGLASCPLPSPAQDHAQVSPPSQEGDEKSPTAQLS